MGVRDLASSTIFKHDPLKSQEGEHAASQGPPRGLGIQHLRKGRRVVGFGGTA